MTFTDKELTRPDKYPRYTVQKHDFTLQAVVCVSTAINMKTGKLCVT